MIDYNKQREKKTIFHILLIWRDPTDWICTVKLSNSASPFFKFHKKLILGMVKKVFFINRVNCIQFIFVKNTFIILKTRNLTWLNLKGLAELDNLTVIKRTFKRYTIAAAEIPFWVRGVFMTLYLSLCFIKRNLSCH